MASSSAARGKDHDRASRMKTNGLSYVFLGLSITSSWGNGHATTYRSLLRELSARGHDVLFLERDLPFYKENRDLARPPYGRTALYDNLEDLADRFTREIREADFVIVGSYVPEGIAVAEWIMKARRGPVGFYDIDTPVTLAGLETGDTRYLSKELIPRYDLYLSFTGGPALRILERTHGAKRARALHCGVDPEIYRPEAAPIRWDLGYLGTYSEDRQPPLEQLLLDAAGAEPERRFVVAGAQYPESIRWHLNVEHFVHLPPSEHRAFYGAQRFTLNVTRLAMRRLGYSPSVRLFEAAACATPVISDAWSGISAFFEPGREILLVESTEDVRRILAGMPEEERLAIGRRARARVLSEHTAEHRAATFEAYTKQILDRR